MIIEYNKIKSPGGPGVNIHLNANELAEAITEYVGKRGVEIKGARTVFVNGEKCHHGNIFVDPSGEVTQNVSKMEVFDEFYHPSRNAMHDGVHREEEVLTHFSFRSREDGSILACTERKTKEEAMAEVDEDYEVISLDKENCPICQQWG